MDRQKKELAVLLAQLAVILVLRAEVDAPGEVKRRVLLGVASASRWSAYRLGRLGIAAEAAYHRETEKAHG